MHAKQAVLGRKQSVWYYKQKYKQLNYQHITLQFDQYYIKYQYFVQVKLWHIFVPTQRNMLIYNVLYHVAQV